ncbi:MAG: hypothetical protein JXR94_05950 [Candidatus Hydrogenedentes bacterium]|nr:hypothetical protein [Candidatus Hydrogenedentota bacterium]
MNLAALAIVAASLAAEGDCPIEKPVQVTMVAVQATRSGPPRTAQPEHGLVFGIRESGPKRRKEFSKDLEEIRPALEALDFDVFTKVNAGKAVADAGREVQLPINRDYTLFVTPLCKDREGRIRIKGRVEEKVLLRGNKKPVSRQALSFTSAIAPNKPLRLGGFRLGQGELIVVLSVDEYTPAPGPPPPTAPQAPQPSRHPAAR